VYLFIVSSHPILARRLSFRLSTIFGSGHRAVCLNLPSLHRRQTLPNIAIMRRTEGLGPHKSTCC
jgi:hypothetical protein